jgi:hypothetical protein
MAATKKAIIAAIHLPWQWLIPPVRCHPTLAVEIHYRTLWKTIWHTAQMHVEIGLPVTK